MNEEFSEEEKGGFYKAIFSRRDVRSHFTSRPIDEEIIMKILKAAHHAPSVGFSQPWNFILIKDNETKKKIKESFEKEREYSAKLVEEPRRSNDVLKRVLDLPEHVTPIAYLCLGYVEQFAKKPDLETAGWLPRLDLKDVVYYEKWNQKQNSDWNKIEELIRTNIDYA